MKKTIAILLTLVLTLGLFAGCGKQADKTITVAASPTPHAEILRVAAKELEKEGYTLKIVEYADYVVPNEVVESGDADANYFQHQPYLDTFNQEHGTHLVSVATLHYEPFGIYAGTVKSLDALSQGDKVAIPNDGTNRARALLLLEANGLIKLKTGADLTATKLDIVENPKELEIVEMEAAQLPRVLDSVAIAVINGNYALGAGLSVGKDALAAEDSASVAGQTYGNVLVVKEGNENSDKTKVLIQALESDAVRSYMEQQYDGAVVPLF